METLKYNDALIFKFKGLEFTYLVQYAHLMNCSGWNRDVLDALFSNNDEHIHEFLRKHYGYEPIDGIWPMFENEDFDAITRTVKAMAEMIQEMGGTTQINGIPYTPLLSITEVI